MTTSSVNHKRIYKVWYVEAVGCAAIGVYLLWHSRFIHGSIVLLGAAFIAWVLWVSTLPITNPIKYWRLTKDSLVRSMLSVTGFAAALGLMSILQLELGRIGSYVFYGLCLVALILQIRYASKYRRSNPPGSGQEKRFI
jgi:Ca2+/Na+ antiporter